MRFQLPAVGFKEVGSPKVSLKQIGFSFQQWDLKTFDIADLRLAFQSFSFQQWDLKTYAQKDYLETQASFSFQQWDLKKKRPTAFF